jgi:Secretion system C-terminal sorting domain/Beta-propeller repeat
MKKFIILFLLGCSSSNAQFNYQRSWATYYGGIGTNKLNQDVDSQGNLIIVGTVTGTIPYSNSFVTTNAHQANYGGGYKDGFMAKYNSNGTLLWATFFGGAEDDIIGAITIDENDDIYIAGNTNSPQNIATQNTFQPNLPTDGNAGFLAKFNSNGIQQWGTYYLSNTFINGISLYSNTIILFGLTSNTSDVATPNAFQTISNGLYTNFITKFNRIGQRDWSTYYNSPFYFSVMTASAINNSGIYISGQTTDNSGFYATPGCHQPQNNGYSDNFLTKFDFNGNRLWSTYYGGINYEGGTGIVGFFNMTCNEDSIYLTDSTGSTSNIATSNTFQSTFSYPCRYLAKFDNDGVRQWGTYLNQGTSVHGYDASFSINLDPTGNCFVTGTTNKKSSSTSGAYQTQIAGSNNTIYPEIAAYTDVLVTKFNPNGQREWATYYGGEQNELENTNCIVYNNDFYICGTTQSTTSIATVGSQQPNYEAGNLIATDAGNAFIAKFSFNPLTTKYNVLEKLELFPNPNKGSFTIKGKVAGLQNLEIVVYDNQGRTIYTKKLNVLEDIITVDLENKLQSGMYFVKIFNSEIEKTIKMMVQ